MFRWILLVNIFLTGISCSSVSDRPASLAVDEDGTIIWTNGDLVLSLDRHLGPDVRFHDISIMVEPGGRRRPLNFIVVDGKEVTDFEIETLSPRLDSISTVHGPGERLRLSAVATADEGIKVRQRLTFDIYERYPGLVVQNVSYENMDSDRSLKVDRTVTAHLHLDAKRGMPDLPSFSFHTFQGGSYEWGRSYAAIPITRDFSQKNFMGLYRRGADPEVPEDEGGGINLVDVWNKSMGLALCHLAARDLFVSFPTHTDPEGVVHIYLLEEPDSDLGQQCTIEPGGTYRVQAPVGIVAHQGDYFGPLLVYRDLLMDQGIAVQTDSPSWTYQSYWKTWGWRRDFTLDMVYSRIPQLLELGIRQVQIDDGWQDFVGDWHPNREKYPGGEADVVDSVRKIKELGVQRVYLWWNPLGVDEGSEMAKRAEWLVLGKDGKPATSRVHSLCPAYPPVQEHIRRLVRKWIGEWGYDGVYNDFAMNSVAPACFNPAHNHDQPVDSFAATPEIWRIIWEEAHTLHPDPFVETCICSLPHSLFKNPYTNMTSASDPRTNFQVRARIKVEKATHGPRWAYTDCYVEEGKLDPLPQLSDADFASSVGIGAILNTLYSELSPEEFAQYKKWFDIYFREMLSSGEYLNLYDLIYDEPETHVVRKGKTIYFGFYADDWDGTIELRGLEPRNYRVVDYAKNAELAQVRGPLATLEASFSDFLLIKCIPE